MRTTISSVLAVVLCCTVLYSQQGGADFDVADGVADSSGAAGGIAADDSFGEPTTDETGTAQPFDDFGFDNNDGPSTEETEAWDINEIHRLRQQVRNATPEQKREIAARLHKLVAREFDTQTKHRTRQLQELEARLNGLRAQFNRRLKARKDLIELRGKDLPVARRRNCVAFRFQW